MSVSSTFGILLFGRIITGTFDDHDVDGRFVLPILGFTQDRNEERLSSTHISIHLSIQLIFDGLGQSYEECMNVFANIYMCACVRITVL